MIVSVSLILIGGRLKDDCGFTIRFFRTISSSYITGVKLGTIAAILIMKKEFMRFVIMLLLVTLLLASMMNYGIVLLDPPLIVFI